MTTGNLTIAEMKRLEAASKKLLVMKPNIWVHTASYFQDGGTYNGSVLTINKRGVQIKFDDGDVQRIPRKYLKLGHNPQYEEDGRRLTYIENLMCTALDFQMNVDVVNNSMSHFHLRHRKIKRLGALERVLRRYPDTERGNRELARELWGYNHWTRAKFLRELIRAFRRQGIYSQRTLQRWLEPLRTATAQQVQEFFENRVKGRFATEQHSVGRVLFDWLRLRCGQDAVKADLRVRKFVDDAVKRTVSANVAADALVRLSKSKLKIHPYQLDSLIWHAGGAR